MELPELERCNGEEKIRSYDINFENVCFAYNDKKKFLITYPLVQKKINLQLLLAILAVENPLLLS